MEEQMELVARALSIKDDDKGVCVWGGRGGGGGGGGMRVYEGGREGREVERVYAGGREGGREEGGREMERVTVWGGREGGREWVGE